MTKIVFVSEGFITKEDVDARKIPEMIEAFKEYDEIEYKFVEDRAALDGVGGNQREANLKLEKEGPNWVEHTQKFLDSIKDADIIILDEATAFADPENEYLIQKAFTSLSKNKTVLMIAHRLSSIKNANQIFVIQNGTIIESGKHQELLKSNGVYQKMWNDYQKSIEWRL